ncbi:hypothetical protein [Actinophytocola algeriensis]|uniref:Uncharacterized protein n=1 Tax=Actinophytocola algeriensis TaxID=1768010 RepID=A0A7W7QBJ3_9PSEU|nr:hypothetical protein [Actinophytocola algeriensis]MBB4910121.1 hypothetical protein [Actinophytocola algeriensis]MBE1480891.1 hypothetical protein [Actinophytocola algeriensis]
MKLGHFEENLLAELREIVAEQAVAEQAVAERAVAPRPSRPRRRLVLAAAGAGLVAAGLVVGIPAVTGEHTPAAHAVTGNDDGTVTITVNRLEDPDGLERELAAHGITADVSFAPPGKMCQPFPERFPRLADQPHEVFVGLDRRGDDPLTVLPDDLEGKTLILEGRLTPWDNDPRKQFLFVQYAVSGPVAPCVLVDIFE